MQASCVHLNCCVVFIVQLPVYKGRVARFWSSAAVNSAAVSTLAERSSAA